MIAASRSGRGPPARGRGITRHSVPMAVVIVTSWHECRRGLAMKPRSEQLADLSARAKKAEDAATAARNETRDAVQARVEKLQADADARTARVEQATTSAQDKVAGQWASMQAQVKA